MIQYYVFNLFIYIKIILFELNGSYSNIPNVTKFVPFLLDYQICKLIDNAYMYLLY